MYSTYFGLDIALFMFPISHGPLLVLFLQNYITIRAEEPQICISMICTASSH